MAVRKNHLVVAPLVGDTVHIQDILRGFHFSIGNIASRIPVDSIEWDDEHFDLPITLTIEHMYEWRWLADILEERREDIEARFNPLNYTMCPFEGCGDLFSCTLKMEFVKHIRDKHNLRSLAAALDLVTATQNRRFKELGIDRPD